VGTFIPADFTIGTHWISWIKAYDRLRDWIREELAEASSAWHFESTKNRPRLQWTGSKADLVVLLCALFLAKCFNNGLCTLKEVMEWGQEEFGIKMDQFHVTLGEVSIRKDPIKFFKTLIEKISRKFDSMTG
jgi:hypothetical protein